MNTSKHPEIDFLEEGSIFEHDGHLYLVEERHISIRVHAQRIESQRALMDQTFEDGNRSGAAPHTPCFISMSGTSDCSIWDTITPYGPEGSFKLNSSREPQS